jgi:hypothetical protein
MMTLGHHDRLRAIQGHKVVELTWHHHWLLMVAGQVLGDLSIFGSLRRLDVLIEHCLSA